MIFGPSLIIIVPYNISIFLALWFDGVHNTLYQNMVP